jgi:Tol biopolymer transport system component
MKVNIALKDGTYIQDANIFPTDKSGEYAITDEDEINNKFTNYNRQFNSSSNFLSELISFQTSCINGKFHPANVEYYQIVK